jgi:L-fuconolactonase
MKSVVSKVGGIEIESPMIIDSHQHFWQVGRFDYPWMSSEVEVLYRDYLPAQLKPILAENGVTSTVLVQASNSLEESRWLLELAESFPFIAGVVGWVDLGDAEVDSQLNELAAHPKFKGVRHLVESEPDDRWLLQPAVLRGLERLAAHDLSYDLLIRPRHLEYAEQVVRANPSLRFVVDHMAKPPIANREVRDWATKIKPLGALPNVYCKLSGLVTEASWESWTTADLQPFVKEALEVFGVDRLMFGSDHPVCLLAAAYGRVLDSFRETLHPLKDEDQVRIFAENARSFYRLN